MMLHNIRPAQNAIETADFSVASWSLGVSGILVLASAPSIDSKFEARMELQLLTIIVGDHQWISRGVPLFLILHLGFSYYFGTWKAARYEQRVEEHISLRNQSRPVENVEWVLLAVCLVALKAVAIYLVHRLLRHAHALAAPAPTPNPNSNVPGTISIVDFVILPLAVAAIDHLADVKTARNGDIGWAWANLIQSTLQTYFFTRPLAALAGHNIDPTDGRMGIGLCLLAVAVWLAVPGLPREYSQFSPAPSAS
jgi:hypothetical protein